MRERLAVVGEVPFGRGKRLVVSRKGRYVILGQKVLYPTDDGSEQWAFLAHAANLNLTALVALRDALTEAIKQVEKFGSETEGGKEAQT